MTKQSTITLEIVLTDYSDEGDKLRKSIDTNVRLNLNTELLQVMRMVNAGIKELTGLVEQFDKYGPKLTYSIKPK